MKPVYGVLRPNRALPLFQTLVLKHNICAVSNKQIAIPVLKILLALGVGITNGLDNVS